MGAKREREREREREHAKGDYVSCSYFFLEYSTANEAAEAVKTCNGYKLDKKHIFAVNKFTDFDK